MNRLQGLLWMPKWLLKRNLKIKQKMALSGQAVE